MHVMLAPNGITNYRCCRLLKNSFVYLAFGAPSYFQFLVLIVSEMYRHFELKLKRTIKHEEKGEKNGCVLSSCQPDHALKPPNNRGDVVIQRRQQAFGFFL